jgi:hypothetical protein
MKDFALVKYNNAYTRNIGTFLCALLVLELLYSEWISLRKPLTFIFAK